MEGMLSIMVVQFQSDIFRWNIQCQGNCKMPVKCGWLDIAFNENIKLNTE